MPFQIFPRKIEKFISACVWGGEGRFLIRTGGWKFFQKIDGGWLFVDQRVLSNLQTAPDESSLGMQPFKGVCYFVLNFEYNL